MAPLFLELLVDVLHADAHGLGGRALQVHVERRVNAMQRGAEVPVLERSRELVIHHVDEVGRVGGLEAAGDYSQRRLGFDRVLAIGDEAVLAHQRQDQVAPLFGVLRVAVRIVVIRVSGDPGERRRLMSVEIADVLSKVRLRGLAKTVDAEAAALAHADLVAVVFEDFVFRKLLLELEGDHHLSGFTLPVLSLIEPEFARELHAERGRALFFPALLQIVIRRFHDAVGIEARVLEEALVFRRQDRLHQHFRDVVEVDDAALFAIPVGKIGDQLRLELELRARGVVLRGDDAGDFAVREFDDARFGLNGVRSGNDFDGIGAEVIPAEAI